MFDLRPPNFFQVTGEQALSTPTAVLIAKHHVQGKKLMGPFNIGETAKASGLSAKMIRHYESVGLFPETCRTEAGYRQYTDKEVSTLRFIRQSRDLGFSIEQIRELLGLWQNQRRPSRQVKALAQAHLQELDAKLQELQAMKATLTHLVDHCHGDDRPDCPIVENLADEQRSVSDSAPHRFRGSGLLSGRH